MTKDGGWRLPLVVNPEETYPVCICIPAERYHIAAFWGALQQLGYQHNWERDTSHTALTVSVLWNSIIEAAYEKYKGGAMCGTCEDFITCLSDPDFITALDDALAAIMADKSSALYAAVSALLPTPATSPYGTPLSNPGANLAEGTNPTCDKDILYGQCLGIVRLINDIIVDTLQKLEAASNAGEIAKTIAELPALNLVTRNVGILSALELADKALELFDEGYIAAYDTAKETQYACALYCACQSDCEITVTRLVNAFHKIVSAHGYFPVFGNLLEWLTWFKDAGVTGGVVADVAFYASVSVLKVANFLLFDAADFLLPVAIARLVNNPDGDWIFCDCPICLIIDAWNRDEYGAYIVSGTGTLPVNALAEPVWFADLDPRLWLILRFDETSIPISIGSVITLTFEGVVDMGNPYGAAINTTVENVGLTQADVDGKVWTGTATSAGYLVGFNGNLGNVNDPVALLNIEVCG